MKPESEKFLSEIRSGDAEVRYAAWMRGSDADPEVVPELGKLLVADEPPVRKAADEALKRMVHGVGKQPGGARRGAVVKELIGLTADSKAAWTRTIALRHLSLIGGDDCVAAVAKLLRNPEVQEEAVFCLERIPGKASTQALVAAASGVGDAFKPRVLAALGHRKAEEATDLCASAIESPDPEVMMAALKATGRIGKKPSGNIKRPSHDSLNAWQKVEYADSVLRFADDQARRGNVGDAVKYYREFLNRPEEHLQCAAIIGLSKSGSAEAADLISTKLTSPNNTVRITASKARAAMGKA